jgi:lysophospholipase L1-like esterase
MTILLFVLSVSSSYAQTVIPRTNWMVVFADSQDVVTGGAAEGSFDGNTGTMWHTQWFDVTPNPPPPHEIQINLGAIYEVSGFRYLPRQDGSQNGWIGQYEFYVSLDGVEWGTPVATGTFAPDALEKEVLFTNKTGQYVRLLALSEVNGNPWTSMAELNVLQSTCVTPSVSLVQPKSYYLQTSIDLPVLTDTCLTAGQGVRFMLDGGTQVDVYSAPFGVTYTALSNTEHVIDAFVIDSEGTPVTGIATHDQAIQVGIGDYYVAMGDSITRGFGDSVSSDDVSQDGRNTGGGYTPILDDLLTGAKGYPQTVMNEGIGGTTSADGVALIPQLLQKHPNAQRFLIMYGTNDSAIPIPSGLGLQPDDPLYPGTFKDNMQRIIDAINIAGKVAILAKAPVVLPVNDVRDTMIQDYNLVIDELVANPANQIPVAPPDFHAYFATQYTTEYSDALHPNGFGYQSMANLWWQVLFQ